ncbi:dNTP triphosphohydrolase [Paracoccaceae bacterium]|nr:dNTP triphosphohydrolase [Paracoccaceae bacterium]
MNIASDPNKSLGRVFQEDPCSIRSIFQRDRDRIIHSKAFRKLQNKSQVFFSTTNDIFRTRLTHTIEVSQIARTIANHLGLNIDLCETIALAHDLGHPPFGHTGEESLNSLMREVGGFDHNLQTLKVVTILEKQYAQFSGLNLSFESLDGIVKHNGPIDDKNNLIRVFWDENISLGEARGIDLNLFPSLEAQVAALSDDIAYCAHDIADGHEAGILSFVSLKNSPFFQEFLCLEQPFEVSATLSVAQGCRDLIRNLVSDLIEHSRINIKNLHKNSDYVNMANLIDFSSDTAKKVLELKKYLFKNLYRSREVNFMRREAEGVLRVLFNYYLDALNDIPTSLLENKYYSKFKSPRHRKLNLVGDFIASMTDKEALETFDKIRVRIQ